MRYYSTFEEYREAWNSAPLETPAVPLNIDLELTAYCNLHCPFCFLQNKDIKIKRGYMDFELAKRIIDEAAEIGVPALKFNWRGESTLHPQFTPIIKYARRKRTFYELLCNTNGNVPDSAFDGLAACTKVMVSLDSLHNGTYQKMRKGGNLQNVIRTVNILLDRGHENVWVRRVITSENKSEQFILNCRDLWGTKVKIAEHYCFERGCDIDTKLTSSYKRKYCGYPSQRLVIGIDGTVLPCCVDYQESMSIGNINNQTLKEIWNSKHLSLLVKSLKHNVIPQGKQCATCTSFMAYDTTEREYVQDKEVV